MGQRKTLFAVLLIVLLLAVLMGARHVGRYFLFTKHAHDLIRSPIPPHSWTARGEPGSINTSFICHGRKDVMLHGVPCKSPVVRGTLTAGQCPGSPLVKAYVAGWNPYCLFATDTHESETSQTCLDELITSFSAMAEDISITHSISRNELTFKYLLQSFILLGAHTPDSRPTQFIRRNDRLEIHTTDSLTLLTNQDWEILVLFHATNTNAIMQFADSVTVECPSPITEETEIQHYRDRFKEYQMSPDP